MFCHESGFHNESKELFCVEPSFLSLQSLEYEHNFKSKWTWDFSWHIEYTLWWIINFYSWYSFCNKYDIKIYFFLLVLHNTKINDKTFKITALWKRTKLSSFRFQLWQESSIEENYSLHRWLVEHSIVCAILTKFGVKFVLINGLVRQMRSIVWDFCE